MVTFVLIAVNVAVYAYTAFLSQSLTAIDSAVIVEYGQSNLLVLRHGWYWQLFTAMFVHVNIVHIAGNMLFLLIFGLRAEEMFRPEEYLAVYLFSGLAGNVLTLTMGTGFTSAGASGAIFGLFGAVVLYARQVSNQPLVGALAYAFILLMLSIGLNVNVVAHFGGLVAGLIMGYTIARMRPKAKAFQYSYSYHA